MAGIHTAVEGSTVSHALPAESEGSSSLSAVLPLIRCPDCAGSLALTRSATTQVLQCSSCAHEFEIHDGIPLLARRGSSDTWSSTSPSG